MTYKTDEMRKQINKSIPNGEKKDKLIVYLDELISFGLDDDEITTKLLEHTELQVSNFKLKTIALTLSVCALIVFLNWMMK